MLVKGRAGKRKDYSARSDAHQGADVTAEIQPRRQSHLGSHLPESVQSDCWAPWRKQMGACLLWMRAFSGENDGLVTSFTEGS